MMTFQTLPSNPALRLMPARARLNAVRGHLALWTLQGWLAMFFAAAGYAKLSEPMGSLVLLLGWPASTGLEAVRWLGVAEIGLAALVLAPLFSWRIGRPLLIAGAAALLALENAMLILHLSRAEPGLAIVNAILIGLTAPILRYRAATPRPASR